MYHLYLSSSGFFQLLRTYQFADLGGIVNIDCKVILTCVMNFWQLIQYNTVKSVNMKLRGLGG